jgi:hypothetical protein
MQINCGSSAQSSKTHKTIKKNHRMLLILKGEGYIPMHGRPLVVWC